MKLTSGTKLGAYEILSPLGAGGMGEVYRARDTRLNREVAIKVLPADFAKDADRLRRFEQEALATSALNHPNILTIYEFGSVSTEAGATHFLTSEFIDGETLRNRLQRTPLTLNEAIDIAVQTAQALAAAHEANIIHRDIKPENVMLRKDGIVKVLDFGLAKLTEVRSAERAVRSNEGDETLMQPPPAAPQLTMPGAVMGTVAYMSPEQARGQTVDARTDLFSLGVMLYEMLARRQPFTGETVNHVIVAILEKEPPPLTGVPAELTRILEHALAKKAEERYGSAQAMLAGLKKLQTRLLVEAENKRNSADYAPVEGQTLIQPQATAAAPEALATAAASAQPTSPDHPKPKQWWLAAGLSLLLAVGGYFGYGYFTATRQINSIAVMPFVNESGNADVEYLSDGMTETLISRLSNIPNLSVKARSTVFYYKGKQTSPKTIGEELKVQAVLIGRVSQRGDDLKLSLELVNTETQDVIWSEQYNRKQSDLVSLQSEIARTVSDKLRAKLTATEQERVTRTNTTSSEAQQLYLKGRFHWNKRTTEDFQKAREYFQQAIAADPNYALAHTGLADTLALMPYYGAFRPNEYMPLAKQAAQKALEIDPNLAEAHASLGQILTNYDYDFKGAERELKRAIELDPKYPSAYQWLSEVYHYLGNGDQTLSEINKALELDPLSLIINNQKGRAIDFGGKRDEAIVQFKKTIELFPDAASPRNNLADVYEAKGMYSEAVEQRLIQVKLLFGLIPENIKDLQIAFEKGGYKGFVQKQIDIQLDSQRSSVEKDKNAYLPAFRIAVDYARLGDKDKAFGYLNKAYDQREPQIAELKIRLPLSSLRDDPRFKELVRKAGIPE